MDRNTRPKTDLIDEENHCDCLSGEEKWMHAFYLIIILRDHVAPFEHCYMNIDLDMANSAQSPLCG